MCTSVIIDDFFINSKIDQHEEFYSIYLISLYIWAHSSSLSEQISDILLVK